MSASVRVDATATEVVLTREFAAPRETVFRAWTDPEWLVRWWAPDGFTTPHASVDLRVGGSFHYCMRSPEGQDYWGMGRYTEVMPPEKLVYVDSFADPDGNPVGPGHYGLEDHPEATDVEVRFDDVAGGTRVTIRFAMPEDVPAREGATQGWSQMLDRLAAELESGD